MTLHDTSPGLTGVSTYTPTLVGWSSTTILEAKYIVLENACFCSIAVSGTSNSTSTTATLPIPAASVNSVAGISLCSNNGTSSAGRYYFSSTTVVTFGPSATSDTWTASGTKVVQVNFWYPLI